MTNQLPDLCAGRGIIIKRVPGERDGEIEYTATICGYEGWLIGTVRSERENEVVERCVEIRERIEQDDLAVFDLMLPLLFEEDAEPVEAVWPPVAVCGTCGMGCYGGRACTLCAKWRVPGTKAIWQNVSV
jgi:hypothetical protein